VLAYDHYFHFKKLVFLREMARPERFELPTLCFEGRCSIQLSYGRAVVSAILSLRRVLGILNLQGRVPAAVPANEN
jgi:hypothetical protein